MRLKTNGRYAVTAMIDVAMFQDKGPVSLGDISKRRKISQSYLEQIFAKLRRNNLVVSTRGPGGGYRINGDLNNISIASIINSIDKGSLDATQCGTGECDCVEEYGCTCLTHSLWTDLSQVIDDYLSKVTLKSIVEKVEI